MKKEHLDEWFEVMQDFARFYNALCKYAEPYYEEWNKILVQKEG